MKINMHPDSPRQHCSGLSKGATHPQWINSLGSCTIGERLSSWAHLQPNEPAYIFLEDGEEVETIITYSELHEQSTSLARTLLENSGRGTKALLAYPAGLEFIKAFFACIYAGIPAIPVYVAPRLKDLNLIEKLLIDSGGSLVLTCDRLIHDMNRLNGDNDLTRRLNREIKIIDTSSVHHQQDRQTYVNLPHGANSDIAFIQYTSGSTNIPKGVMLTHANIIENEIIISKAFEHNKNTVGMGWLPHYHDMGLIGNILQTMYIGRPCILMSPLHFVQRPLRWLMAISRYRATSSGGPNFAYELCVQKCRSEQIKDLDLSSWKLAFVGAEMISAKTLRSFADKFSACGFNEKCFYPCYGLAESTLFVTGRHERGLRSVKLRKSSIRKGLVDLSQEADDQTIEVVGCGNTWGNHDVIIVDPDTHKRCTSNRIGEIWVSGPSVAKGYWGRANLTTKVFSATVMGESSRKTYLKTGDLGFTDGCDLFVTGRIKDIIVIRGHNYYPYDIEHTVARTSPHLIATGTAAFAMEVNELTELVIVQEVSRTGVKALDYDETTKLIRSSVVKNHGISPSIIVLVKPHTIPRTSSGKIQRGKCKDMLISEQLSELHRWFAHVIHN